MQNPTKLFFIINFFIVLLLLFLSKDNLPSSLLNPVLQPVFSFCSSPLDGTEGFICSRSELIPLHVGRHLHHPTDMGLPACATNHCSSPFSFPGPARSLRSWSPKGQHVCVSPDGGWHTRSGLSTTCRSQIRCPRRLGYSSCQTTTSN